MKEYILKFIEWTKLKIRINNKNEVFYFHEREIWRASLGYNIGQEQNGKHDMFERPVLILKKFNNDLCWILPLTSKNKKGLYYYQCEYKGRKSTIILSQLKLISGKRLIRKMGVLSEEEFNNIRNRVKNLL